ncbi:MAG: hypothetical protein WCJ64_04190 [Rhodospirillaceae bacterium]
MIDMDKMCSKVLSIKYSAIKDQRRRISEIAASRRDLQKACWTARISADVGIVQF